MNIEILKDILLRLNVMIDNWDILAECETPNCVIDDIRFDTQLGLCVNAKIDYNIKILENIVDLWINHKVVDHEGIPLKRLYFVDGKNEFYMNVNLFVNETRLDCAKFIKKEIEKIIAEHENT